MQELTFAIKLAKYDLIRDLPLGSGATALGSVMAVQTKYKAPSTKNKTFRRDTLIS
jgi:hypothetical protein